MYSLSNPCRANFGGGALLLEIAPEIVHFNLTRVLQRLGVVEDQDRAGFDLGLGNRPLLAVKISRVDNILAVPSVGCGYLGSDPPLVRETIYCRAGGVGGTIDSGCGPFGNGYQLGWISTGADCHALIGRSHFVCGLGARLNRYCSK